MTIRVGRWLGENGGGLEILSIGPGAYFTGRYQTKVGKPDPNAWFDAHGMTDGKLGDEVLMNTCFPCHNQAKARDLVFTRYAP